MAKLTDKIEVPFCLVFRDKLAKGYTFEQLDKRNIKDFQAFLGKISNMTVDQVDKEFARQPDKQDVYCDKQVLHYGVTEKFRIHGIRVQNGFMVIRLDPNHKVHK